MRSTRNNRAADVGGVVAVPEIIGVVAVAIAVAVVEVVVVVVVVVVAFHSSS